MEGEPQLNLRQIVQVLEDVLGRPSRWNGEALLESGLFFAGAAHYSGSVGVSEVIFADFDLRWRTLVHEALHTFSPQYAHMTYSGAIGWEEGVTTNTSLFSKTSGFALEKNSTVSKAHFWRRLYQTAPL